MGINFNVPLLAVNSVVLLKAFPAVLCSWLILPGGWGGVAAGLYPHDFGDFSKCFQRPGVTAHGTHILSWNAGSPRLRRVERGSP